ncbi:MAG: hypothetical protein ACXAEN_26695 [Candidatus Thorarchaeota archaeon]|jgi:hypothetical protein
MERKYIAVCVVAVLTVASVAVILVLDPFGTHYEASMQEQYQYAGIHIEDMRNGNVTVSYVDDPTLLYSIDFVQASSGPRPYIYSNTLQSDAPNIQLICDGDVDSVDVVLGNTIAYHIVILGINLTTTVAYNNDAVIGANQQPSRFTYDASGTLEFIFSESVNYTSWGLEVRLNDGNGDLYVGLDIDLPDGLEGSLDLRNADSFNIVDQEGWWHRGNDLYSTAVLIEEPALVMYAKATVVLAWLYN